MEGEWIEGSAVTQITPMHTVSLDPENAGQRCPDRGSFHRQQTENGLVRPTTTERGSPKSKVLSFIWILPWPGYSTEPHASRLRLCRNWVNHTSIGSVSSGPHLLCQGILREACRIGEG